MTPHGAWDSCLWWFLVPTLLLHLAFLLVHFCHSLEFGLKSPTLRVCQLGHGGCQALQSGSISSQECWLQLHPQALLPQIKWWPTIVVQKWLEISF